MDTPNSQFMTKLLKHISAYFSQTTQSIAQKCKNQTRSIFSETRKCNSMNNGPHLNNSLPLSVPVSSKPHLQINYRYILNKKKIRSNRSNEFTDTHQRVYPDHKSKSKATPIHVKLTSHHVLSAQNLRN